MSSKSVHEDAHRVFYESNKFFLTKTGSLFDQHGLKGLTCTTCCAQSSFKFETGLVHLGHNRTADTAFAAINDLTNFFQTPSVPLTIKHLTIDVKFFFFRTETQVERFVHSLRKVRVTDRLTITGLDIHVKEWMHDVTNALMLRYEPVDFQMDMRDPETSAVEPFRAEYVPATSRYDMTAGLATYGDLVDPMRMLTQYEGFAASMDDERYAFRGDPILRR